MRWIIILLGCAALAAAAEAPRGLRLEGHALAPARATAAWLGAELTAEADGRLTLTRGDTVLCAAFTRRAATRNGADITFPAPALRANGTGYLPARALAEAFGATVAWDAKTHTLTLTRPEAPPLVLPTTPLPRPACLTDDTLAGLTIGDHLALAVLRWGDYTAAADGAIPGTRAYTFDAEAARLVTITVVARDEAIVLVEVTRGDADGLPTPALLRATGTNGGLALGATAFVAPYRAPRWVENSPSGDSILAAYPRGHLLVVPHIGHFESPSVQALAILLAHRDTPRAHLRAHYRWDQ